ncbi:MAG TPA: hypothetical protein VIN10_05950 [Bacteroidales bacterium]
MKLKASYIAIFFTIVITSFYACEETFDLNPDSSTDYVKKYLGTWHVSDQAARLNYDVVIKRNPGDSTSIILENFADMRGSAIGMVIGNTVVISLQPIGGGMMSEGSGNYLSASELKFNFVLDNGIDSESRVGFFSK